MLILKLFNSNLIIQYNKIEASRGAGAQGVAVKLIGCRFDPLSRK